MKRRLLNDAVAVALTLSVVWLPNALARTDDLSDSTARLASDALKRGEEMRRKWNLAGAEAAFSEAASLEPGSLEASLGLARVARVKLEYARALSFLHKAASIHPNSAAVLSEYGSIYLAAEESNQARHYFESARKVSPSDISAAIGLAGVDLLERDFGRGVARLRECLVTEPQNGHVHAMLSRVLLESNRISEAADEASRAISLDPFDADALSALAHARSSERKADETRSLARRVVSLDPFNVSARRLLSQYLDGKTGYDQKVSEAARTHYERGRALKQDGELAPAVTEFQAALRFEPRYYRALIGLGDIWLRQGDYERAAAFARLAVAVDPEGSLGQLELSYAYRGISERARIEIGAVDFAALFHNQPSPPAYAITGEIFPDYRSLTKRQQSVIDSAVAPLGAFLPKLARHKARHYLLAFDQRPSDLRGFADITGEKTFDGRYYSSLRGVGGRITVSGIEYLDQAARGGFNTIAHEFAHQVHIAALGKKDVKTIRKLYERARREGRTLDYYAAANEEEYFAQGYEAFVSNRKRPSAGITARHTDRELMIRDPQLYSFLLKLTAGSSQPSALSR
ncbi:MAG TPA: tetratricopeptide repeat protein [Blastocatellia bacterium]